MEQPFDTQEFPFAFLQAFNKETTLRRLLKGESSKSDLGGVLQTNNIHDAVAAPGKVTETLAALKASPATVRAKVKFTLATDGETFEAEDLASGETVACAYADFPDHFGFFLPLAGITTVKQLRESSFDIRATSRLNREAAPIVAQGEALVFQQPSIAALDRPTLLAQARPAWLATFVAGDVCGCRVPRQSCGTGCGCPRHHTLCRQARC